ncbi:MAG: cobalamin-dependent protein [Magnetococcales bacterium]|nr:cobalamin-dependent protein [Magnetococcales bacterium]
MDTIQNKLNKACWLLINYPMEFPIGLSYISATLKTDPRLSVHCLSVGSIPHHLPAITQKLTETMAGVVGISGFSRNFSSLKQIVSCIRDYDPSIIIVFGGPIISSDPVFIHNKLGHDYGVYGEGEETVLELANYFITDNGIQPEEIAGLVFRDADGQIIKTSERIPKNDIDDIPWPDWEGWDLGYFIDQQAFGSRWVFNTHTDHPREILLLLSRSCPYKCTFCFHSIKSFRMRKMDAVFEEIRALVDRYQINTIFLSDDLFSVNRKRILDFCQRITPYNIYWSASLRVNIAEPELLAEMSKAKCIMVGYGLESMDDGVLRSMRKKITASQIEKACQLTYEANISVQGNFIFGDSQETVETANRTLNWHIKNLKYSIALSYMMVFPGTELYNTALKQGKIVDAHDYIEKGCPTTNTTLMTDKEYFSFLNEAFFIAQFIPAHVINVDINPPSKIKVTVICPHCGEIVFYSAVPLSCSNVMCKQCYGRFNLDPHKLVYRNFISPDSHTNILAESIRFLNEGRAEEFNRVFLPFINEASESDIDMLSLFGTVLLLQGNLEEAKNKFQQAFMYAQGLPDAHNNYGVVLCKLGQIGFGLAHFQMAWAISPECWAAQANAQFVSRWLVEQSFELIPFAQFISDFPSEGLHITVPSLSSTVSTALWPPLRTSSEHPLARDLLKEIA